MLICAKKAGTRNSVPGRTEAGVPHVTVLSSAALHVCYIFYKLKAGPSGRTVATCCNAEFALSWWSGPNPAVSLRRTWRTHLHNIVLFPPIL